MDTTLGSTCAATASTEPLAAGVSLPDVAAVPCSDVEGLPVVVLADPLSSKALVSAAPAPPPTRPAARATAASSATPRRGREASVGCS